MRVWGGGKGGVKEEEGLACAAGRWGSEKVGGHKLIITIDSSMDVSGVRLSLISSVSPVHAKCGARCVSLISPAFICINGHIPMHK